METRETAELAALLALLGAEKAAETKPPTDKEKVLPPTDYRKLLLELETGLHRRPGITLPAAAEETPEAGLGKGLNRMILLLNGILNASYAIRDNIVKVLSAASEVANTLRNPILYAVSKDYKAGSFQVTSSEWSNVWGGTKTRSISFYAKQLDWELRMLTRAGLESGKTIEDMSIIYLPEGSAFDKEIDVIKIEARCPNATAGTPGILLWEVDF